MGNMIALKQRGLRGVGAVQRVAQNPGLARGAQHIGGKAVARREIEPTRGAVAGFKRHAGRGHCGAGGDRHNRGAGGSDRIGAGGIARHARTVKLHAVKAVKERGINHLVKKRSDGGIAEPSLAICNHAEIGPAHV